MCLHEQSFFQAETYTATYWPLLWTKFGGLGGRYLCHLTGIVVHSNGAITGMYFQYDTDDVPSDCRGMGRHSCSQSGCDRPMNFTIDGPGGERITGIEVCCEIIPLQSVIQLRSFGEDRLKSIKVRSHTQTQTSSIRFELGELTSSGMVRFPQILGDHARFVLNIHKLSKIQPPRIGSQD